jgi:hypothetical protein
VPVGPSLDSYGLFDPPLPTDKQASSPLLGLSPPRAAKLKQAPVEPGLSRLDEKVRAWVCACRHVVDDTRPSRAQMTQATRLTPPTTHTPSTHTTHRRTRGSRTCSWGGCCSMSPTWTSCSGPVPQSGGRTRRPPRRRRSLRRQCRWQTVCVTRVAEFAAPRDHSGEGFGSTWASYPACATMP